jgi:hypothetical protein
MKLLVQFHNSAIRPIGIIDFQAEQFLNDVQAIIQIMKLDYKVVAHDWDDDDFLNVFDYTVDDRVGNILGVFVNIHEAIEYFESLKRVTDTSGFTISKESIGTCIWDNDCVYGTYTD